MMDWAEALSAEKEKPYFSALMDKVNAERKAGKPIYPPAGQEFNALTLTPLNQVKVVILGQDPYHGIGQAHGLSFSVPNGVKQPPSLKNIFKEIAADLNLPLPATGNLSPWAKQGVLLLNATLSVRVKQAGSHQKKGWEEFTDSVIQNISQKKEGVIFLLWGRFAQDKAELIDKNKHHILTAPHPSPFSAYTGFFGCKHFSKTNALLAKQGLTEINWKIA